MAAINFYHTTGDTPAALDSILPPLLEKVLASHQQALVICPTESRTHRLDETLWTFAEASFLPHATCDAKFPEAQPILLTHTEQPAPAHAAHRLPVVLAGAEAALDTVMNAEKILYLFTAAQTDVSRARPLYKSLKSAGHTLTYWQQTATGWSKKA